MVLILQQSTMSKNTHHLDNNGIFEFNNSHYICRTCQDWLIVELELKGCEACIFCRCCNFGCPECQCQWDEVEELVEKFLEDNFILTRMKNEDITSSKARKSTKF